MKFLAQEWLKAASDDLMVVEEIVDNPLITNAAAFHCQQCVEKCLKAILEEHELRVPKAHSLMTLYEGVKGSLDLSFDDDILDELDKLYIDARYPSELGLLPHGRPTIEDARRFYEFAKYVYDRIRGYLENRGY